MRILNIVAGAKWTGVAAVVLDWTRALTEAGIEAQFAFVGSSPLAERVLPAGWARPLLTRNRGPAGILHDVRILRETVERERFDILHVHLSHDHYLAVASRTGARLARTIHHRKQLRRDPLSRALFRRTDAFAFANRSIAEEFGAEGPVHSPVVDAGAFVPGVKPEDLLDRLGLRGAACVIGTVAKISRGRGHEQAMDAVAPLGDRSVLLHVGAGEHRPALEARAAAMGAAQRNIWAGYQVEALPLFYRAMDVFVFTASGSQQGQRAILEAMASGLPVAALEVPGVRDLVRDEIEGFVAPGVEALTDAIRRLCGDPALCSRMGEAARRRALEFTGQVFAAKAREFYERLTTRPESPSDAPSAQPSGAPERFSLPNRSHR